MSMRRKLELAVRTLIINAGAAVSVGDRGEDDELTLVVVTSQEDQDTTPALPYVVISAEEDEQISVKARVAWLKVKATVKSSGDRQPGQTTEPETVHAANVDLVMTALLDNATQLNTRLSSTTLTVIGVMPQGPVSMESEDRVLMDGESWRCLCFEGAG